MPARPNGVRNGDFEAGLNEWQSTGTSPLAVEQQANTGDHALRLATEFVPDQGVPGEEGSAGSNSTLSQRVVVPNGQPYLAFAYRVESGESQPGHDKFEVILAGDGQAPTYLYTQEIGSDWRYRFIDLQAFAGQEASLIFNVYQSSPQRPTSALLDVVTLSDTAREMPLGFALLYLPLLER